MILKWSVFVYLLTSHGALLGMAFLVPLEFVLDNKNGLHNSNPQNLSPETKVDLNRMQDLVNSNLKFNNFDDSMMDIPVLLNTYNRGKMLKYR